MLDCTLQSVQLQQVPIAASVALHRLNDGTDCFKRKMTKSTACILDAGFPMERLCHRLCSIIDSAGSIVTQMRCIGSKFPVIHYGYRVSYI
jgi:hypothetical protein